MSREAAGAVVEDAKALPAERFGRVPGQFGKGGVEGADDPVLGQHDAERGVVEGQVNEVGQGGLPVKLRY